MSDRRKPTLTVQTSVLGRAAPPCEICLKPTSFVRYTDVGDKRVGRFAHVRGVKNGAARHDPDYPAEKLDTPENLFWCCTDCHDIVDKKEKWTLDKLTKKLAECRARGGGTGLLVVDGEITVYGEDAKNVIGIDAGGKPTVLKAGTKVNVTGKGSDNVTGIKN